MIFSADKGMYQLALLSEKTLTTRMKLPAHIAVGKEWAIVPKRAAPAWWFRYDDGVGEVETDPRGFCTRMYGDTSNMAVYPSGAISRLMLENRFEQARIRIDGFWQTTVQFMSELDALDEGVNSVKEYAVLWNKINKAKGTRWNDNPAAWRIRFSLPQDVCIAVSKVGREAIMGAANAQS